MRKCVKMVSRPCGSSGMNSGASSGGGGDVPGNSSNVLGSSSDVAHNDDSNMSDDNLVSITREDKSPIFGF